MRRATSARCSAGMSGRPPITAASEALCLGIVVFLRARQRHDEAARDVVRHAVHVVDLGREQQFADVGEHRIRHHRAGGILRAVDRRRDTAGIEALGDGDEFDHRLADVGVTLGVETVGLDHQRAGTDQEIAEAGARADAGMAVMRRVGRGEETALLGFAGQEDAIVRDEDVVEDHDADGLAIFGRELRRSLAGPARGPRHDGDAGRIARHGAAHGEIRVLRQRGFGKASPGIHACRARR